MGEATHLLRLTKAYLDESGEPGLLLALADKGTQLSRTSPRN